MFANLNGWHMLILLAVVLLLFGAAKLPSLAKSVGQSARIFKGEMKAMKSTEAPATETDDAVTLLTEPAATPASPNITP